MLINDCLFYIFLFLDSKDLLRCELVCNQWRQVIHSYPCLWHKVWMKRNYFALISRGLNDESFPIVISPKLTWKRAIFAWDQVKVYFMATHVYISDVRLTDERLSEKILGVILTKKDKERNEKLIKNASEDIQIPVSLFSKLSLN